MQRQRTPNTCRSSDVCTRTFRIECNIQLSHAGVQLLSCLPHLVTSSVGAHDQQENGCDAQRPTYIMIESKRGYLCHFMCFNILRKCWLLTSYFCVTWRCRPVQCVKHNSRSLWNPKISKDLTLLYTLWYKSHDTAAAAAVPLSGVVSQDLCKHR